MAPKRDLVMSWIDYWADTYGKFMPHKSTIVIYAANKQSYTRIFAKRQYGCILTTLPSG
ncbi:unnamed protein product [Choristocarpus tenellus]